MNNRCKPQFGQQFCLFLFVILFDKCEMIFFELSPSYTKKKQIKKIYKKIEKYKKIKHVSNCTWPAVKKTDGILASASPEMGLLRGQ